MPVRAHLIRDNRVTLATSPASADVGFWYGCFALGPTITRESVVQERSDQCECRNWRQHRWSCSDVSASGVTVLVAGCEHFVPRRLTSGSLAQEEEMQPGEVWSP